MAEALTPIPQLYDEATPPLPGYENVKFKVLLNPTQGEWRDWLAGMYDGDEEQGQRYGRALVAIFGQSRVPGYDFSTPKAAIQTIQSEDSDCDLIYWLLALPETIRDHRRNLIEEHLPKSWASASAMPST